MRQLKQWFSSSSPTVKTLMAISITSLLFVTHKLYLSPYLKKQRYRQAEEWANTVIEQEEKMKDTNNEIY